MLDLKLHRLYSDISYASHEQKQDINLLKSWCDRLNRHWEKEIELSALNSQEDMIFYLEKFVDYFAEKLKQRIDDLEEAKNFIDSLEINFEGYTHQKLIDSSIAMYNQKSSEKVDVVNWKASRIYGVVEAYLRHTRTDYDVWLKQMTRRVRDEGAYDYLKKRIRSELETQYPELYWFICHEQNKLRKTAHPKVIPIGNDKVKLRTAC